jgi:MFS family permease
MHATAVPAVSLKSDANFRWLLRGGIVSSVGDQLTIVALPLLVLQLSSDPMALGTVIALMGLPRAVFLLIGGALVDRWSPRGVLMASKLANAILLGALTVLVLGARAPSLATVGALAFCLGLAQAFGIPAGTAIMPSALPRSLLEQANGALMGVRQLAMLAGPLLAAVLLGLSRHGLALAFAIDCASFIVSAWTLARVVTHAAPAQAAPHSVWHEVQEGLRMAWRDVPLRLCLMYWAVVSLSIGGVMQVALPLLASDVFNGGTTLGWFLGAHGGGMLLGMATAALGGKRLVRFGRAILLLDGAAGVLVAPLGLTGNAWLVAALLLGLGGLSGFLQITVYTWIQRRVPVAMMGRAMSLFMFIVLGLAPLSALAAGWLLTWIALPTLFVAGGAMLVGLAAAAWLFTPLRAILADPHQGTPLPPSV